MAIPYTRQQMQGSVRYDQRVLIGNWNEDRGVDDTILKDFLAKKDRGTLKIDRFQVRMATALAPVELTVVRDDGFVHFGDLIQLAHCETGAVLAADIEDVDRRTGEHACAATAAPQVVEPCARNTFLLGKYIAPKLDATTTHYDDDVLRYGQKLRLIANPQIAGAPLDDAGGDVPLCLFSKQVSTTHHCKYSHHQIAGFTTKTDWDSVFKAVTPDPAQRLASDGVEVLAGVPISLLHCATGKLLNLEAAAYPNDFGQEREVSFHNTKGNCKKMMLVHEQHGELTKTIEKAGTASSHWRILTGSKVATLPAARSAAFAANEALANINAGLLRSSLRFEGFRAKLLRMDASGSGKVSVDELLLALRYAGVESSMEEIAAIARHFKHNQAGTVDARAILKQLQMLDTKAQSEQ